MATTKWATVSDVKRFIYQKYNLPPEQVEAIVNDVFECSKQLIANFGHLKIPGFAGFKGKVVTDKKGKERVRTQFLPSKTFKRLIAKTNNSGH